MAIDDGLDRAATYTLKRAVINVAGSGNNTLVAAVTGKKIRVLSYVIVAGGAVTARFESDADGTALTGEMELAANQVLAPPDPRGGHFETAAGELLNLELSGAVNVDGYLSYIEV